MRIIFSGIAIVISVSLYAQAVVTELPVHFGQYFNNPQINPAKGGSKATIELFAGTRRSNGNFAGISTSAFSSFFRINSNDNSFNVVGLDFNNDKEGPVISRNRGYVSYARHQKINDDWFFAGGISLGLYSFGIKANPATDDAGISAAAFDGNGGIFLYSKNTKLGLSVDQFNNAKVRPLDQIIQLSRHYCFIGEQNFTVNEYLKITPSIFARYMENNLNPYMQQSFALGGALNFLLKDIIGFGTSYEKQEGVYAFLNIQNVCGENKKDNLNALSVDFSYFMPNRNNYRTNTQTFELVLRYYYTRTSQAVKKKNTADCPDFKKD